MKTCTKCRESKPLSAFSRNRHAPDGLQWHCKTCMGAVSKRWQQRHPGFFGAYLRAWKQGRPSYFQIAAINYEARQRGIEGELTPAQWEALKARYGGHCLHCGRQEPDIALTVDHVIPLSRRGPNVIENIQPLCASCNSHKFTHSWDYRPFWALRCPEPISEVEEAA